MITSTHLRQHNINSAEYKIKFGPLVSEEYKQHRRAETAGEKNGNFGNKMSDEAKLRISQANKGKIPYNKDISMHSDQKRLLSVKAKERNLTQLNPNIGQKRSEETKEKIRAARNKQIITSESAYKAIETRKKNGYDIAFFKGKTHSEESKRKIIEGTKRYREKIKEENNSHYIELIKQKNLTLLNNIREHFLSLQCNECNTVFARTKQVFRASKQKDQYCPTCYAPPSKSVAELEIFKFISELLPYDIIHSGNRTEIFPLEIDIFVPTYQIGIEYCGLYWHSELEGKDRVYHANKLKLCNDKGIRLITIFEDEWELNKDLIKQKLIQIFGQNKNKIYARKCNIVTLTPKKANAFLNQHHIQGAGRSNLRYGLEHNGELVAVMTFSNSNISRKLNEVELDRFAGLRDHTIVGAAGRLLKHCIRLNAPTRIISYADRRWSDTTAFYSKLGMTLDSITPPNYWYFQPPSLKRIHRYSLRKNNQDNKTLTEWENRQKQGYNRIWDCGHLKFVLELSTQ